MIRIRGLRFGYRSLLFDGLDLDLEPSRITLLTGPNGAGKTTLCRLLTGLARPSSGSVLLNGQEVGSLSAAAIAQALLFLRQEPQANLVANTPLEDLRIRVDGFGRKSGTSDLRLREALDSVGIGHLAERPCHLLSHGEAKRAGLAALDLFPERYWILDEPTVGLDPVAWDAVRSLLDRHRTRGGGALVITHTLEPQSGDASLVLHDGRIDSGATQ